MIKRPFGSVAICIAAGLVIDAVAIEAVFAQEAAQSVDAARRNVLDTVIVSASRERELLSETPASIGVIGEAAVRRAGATHPQQILSQVPGVAVSVTNGEGHTTAIRQPFTTSPLYLFLEDGLPIRATGFFNHNALYELDLPMAGGIEVTRGPGSALYGSDAVGGIVNMLTRAPAPMAGLGGSLDAGSHGWRRLMLEADTGEGAWGSLRGGANLTRSDGWRHYTGYERKSVDLRWDLTTRSGVHLKTLLAAGHIDQDTGANSPLIYNDYRNDPTRNNFPIAYRKVEALRLSMAIEKELGNGLLSITPYVRDNRMELLASFSLSYDPTLYETANRSYGALFKWRQDFPAFMRARLIGGLDVDISPGERKENRLDVIATGSGASRVFSDYRVGARIYDYDVTFRAYSPYLQGEISPLERLRVTLGIRYDALSYDLDNKLAGTSVQGAATSFYGQTPDTTVDYDHVSPKIGATYALSDRMSIYASYNTGFRVPSESQLFRPSVAANAADAAARALLAMNLKPITATQFEIGWRGKFDRWSLDLTAFDLVKRDDLVSQRDIATNLTTNVNAGKTSHRGLEAGMGVELSPSVRLDSALSYARHEYRNWVTAAADFSGNDIEAAPRVLGNTRLSWNSAAGVDMQLEWIHVDDYWLEASNASSFPKYGGHDLFNVRAHWQATPSVALFGRIYNIADTRYADSAQISSGTPVYSPGLPRTYFAGVDVLW
ncbi:TonB-dependent receptor [Steroidobacter denitrificans]|uniref:TonB-dependent receptor n=1 Tax=Steroidobacter denitrificans TaxID=465721 RepID=UPI0009FACBAB|nr:TonB-dependent receptor [Steroidobacter denitrificans]